MISQVAHVDAPWPESMNSSMSNSFSAPSMPSIQESEMVNFLIALHANDSSELSASSLSNSTNSWLSSEPLPDLFMHDDTNSFFSTQTPSNFFLSD
jgi:hypothetical protein